MGTLGNTAVLKVYRCFYYLPIQTAKTRAMRLAYFRPSSTVGTA